MSGVPAVRRFPIGLTLAVGVAFVILIGLGVWQVKRLAWKETLLAQVASAQHAVPRSLDQALSAGKPADFTRVAVRCLAPSSGHTAGVQVFRYAVSEGRLAWRLMGACRTPAGPYDGIVLDRGIIDEFTGATSPGPFQSPDAAAVEGVLRAPGRKPLLGPALMSASPTQLVFRLIDAASLQRAGRALGLARPAPWLLAVQSEDPPVAGVKPSALPPEIPNNHFVYALTWFALAAVLILLYLQALRRRS
ncbi:MAG TPA: SURF1 family protein [Caulobacteraceae bacterium]|nr:SURF1 family protein [Caulobacteraceae bacterium]